MFKEIKDEKAFDGILNQIIDNIQNGHLKAGDALPAERTMAETMGVSRPAVREVLRALELLGIIKTVPGGGNYIADDLDSWLIGPLSILFKLNNGYIRQTQQLRAALELEMAILAARKCTPLDAAELWRILSSIDKAEDEKTRGELDKELHTQIAKIADNPMIYSVLAAADQLIENIIAGTRDYIMKKKDTFKIGELSKLFDIGVDSIRYYEKVGILHPVRNDENNYRMYTIDDVRRLALIRELLRLSFSTDQIREYDEDRNVDSTTSLLRAELDVVDAEIAKLKATRDSIQNRLDTITSLCSPDIQDEFETIVIKELPDRKCVMVTDDNLPDDYVSYYVVKYMQSHNTRIDTIGACDCYTLDIPGSNPKSKYYRTKNVFFFAPYLDDADCNYVLQAGRYLSMTYKGALTKTKELLPQLYTYAQDHQLEIASDPVEMCHIDDYETNDDSEYIIELQLMIK